MADGPSWSGSSRGDWTVRAPPPPAHSWNDVENVGPDVRGDGARGRSRRRSAAANRRRAPIICDPTFTLDLAQARFTGKTGIDVRVSQATGADSAPCPRARPASASITSGGQTQKAQVALNAEAQTATPHGSRPIPAGTGTHDIEYQAALNQQLRGLYESRGKNRSYAVTQF